MSVSAGINTSIRDELSCLETGSNDGNNKTSSLGNSPNEHQNGRNSDNDNIDSPVRDDLESDSSSSKPPGPARISYPDDRLTDDSSLGETDFEADNNHQFEIRDSVLKDSSESNIGNNTSSLHLQNREGTTVSKHCSSEKPDNKQIEMANSSLSVTGIVQRNLGSAITNNSVKMKESVYNFDEEEEHYIPPKPALLNHNNSSSNRFSGSFSPMHSPPYKAKDKAATPAMIFVAKKSRPVPENNVKGGAPNKTKKMKKKKEKKLPEPKEKVDTEVKEIDKRILSLDTSKDLYKEGYLVWGKIRGFSYWPGIITVDPMDGLTVKFMKKNSDIPFSHVHFLGYERSQRAWLPETNIMEFKGIDHFVELGSRIPPNSAKKKDFTPKKTLLERFEKGMDLAESVLPLSFRQRLEKLDLVYVLIPGLKEKEEKGQQRKSQEDHPEEGSNVKSAKKRRKSGGYDSENSSNSGKKKRQKKDSKPVEQPIQLPNFNESELSGQETKEPNISIEGDERKVVAKMKTTKHKIPISTSDQKIKKIKLVTNTKKPSLEKNSLPPATAKRGRKKKNDNAASIDETNQKNKKKIKKGQTNGVEEKSVEKTADNELMKNLNTEECGMGVTVRVSSPVDDSSETEIKDISGSAKPDEFDSDLDEPQDVNTNSQPSEAAMPKLGSLVWGRLPGFPYWPCFVTKCPDTGEYRRMYDASRRCDYHVQFFNWNNESGWVRNTQPWCTLEEFQAKAKTATKRLQPTSKEYKAWRPTGKILQKLTDAFNEAQRTSGMTRRERHNNYVVFYRSKMETTKMTTLITEGPHAKKHRNSGSIDSRTGNVAPLERKVLSSESKSKQAIQKQKATSSKPSGLMKPCPKSVQNKKANSQRRNSKIETKKTLPPTLPKDPTLPPGWSVTIINPDNNRIERQYKSPEGIIFPSIKEATAYLFHQNSIQTEKKLKTCSVDETPAKRNKLFKIKKRNRSYSFNDTILPSYKTRLNRNQENSNNLDKDLGCDGWFVTSCNEIHYGCPESRLTETEHKSGDLDAGRTEYLKDLSIPSSWSYVRTWNYEEKGSIKYKVNPTTSYTCQKFEETEAQNFNSKIELICHLDGIGHPAIQLEQMLTNITKLSQSKTKDSNEMNEKLVKPEEQKDDGSNENVDNSSDHEENIDSNEELLSPINLCEWSVDQARRHPILGRAVTPCYVDMVQLPGIFLQHPSVIVEESENEMVISDYFTKEFIAKKIIYD